MRIAEAVTLLDHLYWTRDRILDQAERVSDALVDADPATTRDLRTTLVHELDVLLTRAGASPGELGYLEFVKQSRGSA